MTTNSTSFCAEGQPFSNESCVAEMPTSRAFYWETDGAPTSSLFSRKQSHFSHGTPSIWISKRNKYWVYLSVLKLALHSNSSRIVNSTLENTFANPCPFPRRLYFIMAWFFGEEGTQSTSPKHSAFEISNVIYA